MGLIVKDRVKETSSSTGAGVFALLGAVLGFKAFSAVCAVGDTVYYAIEGVLADGTLTGEWEVGFGTYSGASTLTRTTVLSSSNADAAVNFSAGTKYVWLDLAATQYSNLVARNRRNLLVNGNFVVNQLVYASGNALAAGNYGHDFWKAGAAGGVYTFAQLPNSTTITLAGANTLIQVVEDKTVEGGTYILSWTGTAQARFGLNSAVPSGAYAASPIILTGQSAGTVMSVEFNAGTLTDAQLEAGAIKSAFERRHWGQELILCQRRICKSFPYATAPAQNLGYSTSGEFTWSAGKAGALAQYSPRILFPVWMRAAPALTLYNPAVANAQVRDFDAGADCSATATYAVSESGFSANCTGNAGTAVGNLLRFGWLATSQL